MSQFFSKNKGGYSGWIILFIIVLILFSTVFIGRFFKKEERIRQAFKNGETISFLILAYNEEKIVKGGAVFFFQSKTNRCSVVSILPKTYIAFGKSGYFTFEEVLKKKVSSEDILNGISNLINQKINYIILIKKSNLIKLIDLISGVEIYSEGIDDPKQKVKIPNDLVLLDGDKSCEYLSYIKSDDDKDNYEQLIRIQNFIRGFLRIKADMFEQLNKSIITNFIFKLVSTNMSLNDFIILYEEIKKKFDNNIKDFSIGMNNIIVYCDRKNLVGYNYVYLPKKSGKWIKRELEDAIANINRDFTENETRITILEILNGTKATGLASRTGEYISEFGSFDILNVGNADSDDYENTIIIVYGNEEKARRLADLIKCERIVVKEDLDENKIDVTLIIGKDFDGKVVR